MNVLEKQNLNKIYVLDASVFINKLSNSFLELPSITSPFIEEEMKSFDAKLEFEKAIHQGVIIQMPSKEAIKKIEDIVKETKHRISFADISVLALALEHIKKGKQVVVVSDDYSVQDIAKRIGAEIMPLIREGITQNIKWIKICPACNHKQEHGDICEICGTKLIYVSKKQK